MLAAPFLHGSLAINTFQLELTTNSPNQLITQTLQKDFELMWKVARRFHPNPNQNWRNDLKIFIYGLKIMIETLNDYEIDLITEFRSHPLFKQIDEISWQNLLAILIQRRFLSLSIVNLYEFVIDALADVQIKQTVRGILNEEFPRNTKGIPLSSHRELLFQDLLNLGATSEMILITSETPTTQNVRNESYQRLVSCLGEKHCQVGLVAFLRFLGRRYWFRWSIPAFGNEFLNAYLTDNHRTKLDQSSTISI